MPQENIPANNRKFKVIVNTPVTYIATSGQLSGEATVVFTVGQQIMGAELVKGFVSTTPEGTAVNFDEVGQTLVQLPIENLSEVKSIIPEAMKKYTLLWVLAGLGAVSAAYYLIKVKKVFK